MDDQEHYICVGICMPDPDSGTCLGCGRPPLGDPTAVVATQELPVRGNLAPGTGDPDSPQ